MRMLSNIWNAYERNRERRLNPTGSFTLPPPMWLMVLVALLGVVLLPITLPVRFVAWLLGGRW